MLNTPNQQIVSRSFPEAREFLLHKITGPDYPVKHLIEQSRNKGHITKGKRGRGGGVVTSMDMAVLLMATLAGDTPQEASNAISRLIATTPQPFFDGDGDTLKGLESCWWNKPFIRVIADLIDTWRNYPRLGIDDIIVTVYRAPAMHAVIDWQFVSPPASSMGPFETRHVSYSSENKEERERFVGHRTIGASFDGLILKVVADWLEDREEHP